MRTMTGMKNVAQWFTCNRIGWLMLVALQLFWIFGMAELRGAQPFATFYTIYDVLVATEINSVKHYGLGVYLAPFMPFFFGTYLLAAYFFPSLMAALYMWVKRFLTTHHAPH